MWRLRLKRLDAWSRLFALSLCGHLLFFIAVFFIYKGDAYHINLTFNARDLNDATIIFLPAKAKSSVSARASQMMSKGSLQRNNKITSASKDIPPAPTLLRTASRQLPSSPKATPDSRRRATDQEDQSKSSAPKDSTIKPSKSTTPPATRLAATAADKKTSKTLLRTAARQLRRAPATQAKSKVNKLKKKNAQEKISEVEKITPQKIEQTKTIEKQAPVENLSAPTDNKSSPITHNDVGAESGDIIYVDQKDLDALQTQHIIQEELSRHFTPPAGLSKELCCELTLTVGFDGAVTRVDIHKSSGAAIFDMSARAAVSKLTLPPWTYGKELTITFNN